MKPRILVVEDEDPIRMGLCDVLAFNGFEPTGAADGDTGLREALGSPWDLLVLDVMLPGVDGFTLCRRAREAWPRVPILLLTARGSEADVLTGFAAGADDYVTKPFSVAQFVARVRALLRRGAVGTGRRFDLGPVVVDAEALVARVGAQEVELSPRDVDVLGRLAAEPQRVFSREDLLREVWGYRLLASVDTRCVDMHMARLRKKLATLTDAPVVETVRGAGYRAGGG